MTNQARQYIIYSQICFYVGLIICLIIRPEGLRVDQGISYYGVFANTLLPYIVALLGGAYFSIRAADALKASTEPILRLALLSFGLLTLGVLVTPDTLTPSFHTLHQACGIALFSLQIGLSVWLTKKMASRLALLLLLVEFLSGLASLFYIAPPHGLLLQTEVIFQLGFAALLLTYLKYPWRSVLRVRAIAKKNAGRIRLSILLPLVILVAAFSLVIINWQSLTDWVRLLGYTPPVGVSQLASQDGFKPYTTHLFYLNRPDLLSTVSAFRGHCPENPGTVVLGCYHSGQNGIFIYAVSDPSLAGVEQVTAAHEVLHAVYARLSTSAKTKLDNELSDFYDHGLNDPTVRAEVKIYQQTEPNAVFDEMSCTFGTELTNLPPDLNTYYSQYFYNRQTIVNYEHNYQSAFTSRQNQINQADAKLAGLKNQINDNLADLTNKRNSLNALQAELNQEASADPSAFNQSVPSFNDQVNAYNAEVETTQRLITDYNQLVDSRNQIAGQLDTLAQAIDTRLTPVSTR